VKNGYVSIDTEIAGEETLKISLIMDSKKVHMDPRVKENLGKVALQRGPVVYAFEEADNPEGIDDIFITRDSQFHCEWSPDLLRGVVKLKVTSNSEHWTAIPYYAWDNRELGKMKVFVEEIDNALSAER
jgi:DUF1680 family protein